MNVSALEKKKTEPLKTHVEKITHYDLMGETFLGHFRGVEMLSPSLYSKYDHCVNHLFDSRLTWKDNEYRVNRTMAGTLTLFYLQIIYAVTQLSGRLKSKQWGGVEL